MTGDDMTTTASLAGRHALVTGGGTGIGRGIARCLLREGARVTLAARRLDVLERAAAELRAEIAGAEVSAVACDVTDEKQVEAAVAAAAGPDGALDLAVANAGSAVPGPFLLLGADAWRFCCELNVVGTANTLRQAALAMRARGGSLVAISTAASAAPEKSMAAYTATKAAVDMIVRCAALELGPYDIRVNAIQPGYVPHETLDAVFPEPLARDLLARTPLGRAGTPEDIGALVVHLARPESRWITGQVIAVDGGMTVQPMADLTALSEAIYGPERVREALEPGPRKA
jgi:NAD(P)-dependent dehydrogenase (short-subunit alcohol dehydrogenase family)